MSKETKSDKKENKELNAEERKKFYDAAVKKQKDGEAEIQKKQREEHNRIFTQKFQRWITAKDLDDHNTRTEFITIPKQLVDLSVIDSIKKRATELGYKITDDTNNLRISL